MHSCSFLVITNPLEDVTRFIHDYNTKYPVHPVFYQGTYAQALNDAKRELKFLLVYLHSETSSPSMTAGTQRITETINFCRNTLSNGDVITYINNNMLIWGCDIASPEGYRVSHSINARTGHYPLLVIIALRDNKMTVICRMEGDCQPDELLARMRRVVSENERWLSAARHERLERSFNQTLRAQQDVAYEESLKADREKERKKREEREELERIEREIQDAQAADERRRDLKERLKMELAQYVPSEPADGQIDGISIVFKLPNGMRITRRFLKNNSLNVSVQLFKNKEFLTIVQIFSNFFLIIIFRTFIISYFAIQMHQIISFCHKTFLSACSIVARSFWTNVLDTKRSTR